MKGIKGDGKKQAVAKLARLDELNIFWEHENFRLTRFNNLKPVIHLRDITFAVHKSALSPAYNALIDVFLLINISTAHSSFMQALPKTAQMMEPSVFHVPRRLQKKVSKHQSRILSQTIFKFTSELAIGHPSGWCKVLCLGRSAMSMSICPMCLAMD